MIVFLVMQNPFIENLRNIYDQKKSVNSRYSLRAFARDCGIDASSLSKILNGKRRPTKAVIRLMGKRLKLSSAEISRWINLNESYLRFQKNIKSLNGLKLTPLELEEFQFIASSSHFAVMECLNLKDFDHSLAFFEKRLGLSKSNIISIIERLKKFKFISVDVNGKYHLERGDTTLFTLPPKTHEPLKQMQIEILQKAIKAIEVLPFEERSQSSLIFSFKTSDLAKLITKLDKVRREINEESAVVGSEADNVYALSLSLFPLTKNQDKELV